MANSLMQLVSDGNLSVVPLTIKFFEQSHIGVYIDDVALPTAGYSYVWSGASTITITPTVVFGAEVSIRRRTPADYVLHDFQAGAVFSETSIDENFRQDLFLLQEAREQSLVTDLYSDLDMHRNKVRNLGNAMLGGDATPLAQVQQIVSASGGNPFVEAQLLEALRRSYAEAGYNLVDGSFEERGTLASATSVLLHEASGKAYSGAGPFPQDVERGTDPTSGGFVDRSQLTTAATAVRFKLSHVASEVVGAIESTSAKQLAGRIRLQSFGDPFVADAAPVFDAAILAATTFGAVVECPFGDYSVARGVDIKANVILEFQGVGSTVTKTTNETTAYVDGAVTHNFNTVFFLSGDSNLCGIKNVNISGTGVTAPDSHSIVTGTNVRFASILDIRSVNCLSGLKTAGELWMSKIRLHSNTCGTHIDMRNDGFKTSLSFENCWAENCGFGYLFNRLHYSSLVACGADYVAKVDGNPYPAHPWNDATSRSVYDLSNCRAVDLAGCGAENCCGQFVVNFNASTITINGIRSFNHESKFTPNYASYPNYHVGIIGTGTEGGRAVIGGLDVDGGYVNPNADASKIAFLSYNYLSSTYGVKGYTQVTMAAYNKSGTIKDVGGVSAADVRTDVLLLNTLKKDPEYSEKISGGNHVTYSSRFLTASTGTQVIIPFTPQGSAWQQHLLKVMVLTNHSNNPSPTSGSAQFGVSSLTSVAVTQHQVLGVISSVTASGMNVILNLSTAHTSGLHVVIELLHQGNSKLNEPGVAMN